MANTLITDDIIAKEALMQLRNNLVMAKLVHRDYKKEFRKVGDTINIRKPLNFVVSDGSTYVEQSINEDSLPLTLDNRKHVGFAITTEDLSLSIERFSERYITPAMIALANNIETSLINSAIATYHTTASSNPGTTPTTLKAFAEVRTEMNRFSVPMENRNLMIGVDEGLELSNTISGLNSEKLVNNAIDKWMLTKIADLTVYEHQLIRSHTRGTADANYTVDGASQTGSTITVADGTGTFLQGDVITLAGVNSVNVITGADTGNLQNFVVTADYSPGGAGDISISPSIIPTGANKTVTASPADDAVIVRIVDADCIQNFGFHKNAISFAMADLDPGPDSNAQTLVEDGYSMTFTKAWDFDEYKTKYRFDALWAAKMIDPRLAINLFG
jgi:hypothetical protein